MQTVTVNGKEFIEYLTNEDIQEIVKKLAKRISNDYKGKNPIFLAVLNGVYVFAADLLRELSINCEISFIKVRSYDGMQSSNTIKQLIGIDVDLSNRHVIILEDIVDTGNTMQQLVKQLCQLNTASLKICCLLFKPDALQQANLVLDYVGKNIPDKFVVGYGLDFDEAGRHLGGVYQLKID